MVVRKALVYSTLTQVFSKTFGLVSIVIIARLLKPEELGIYAIAAATLFVATEIQNLGTGSYIIKKQNLNIEQLQQCIGLTLVLSIFLALLLLISASSLADFYEVADLKYLFWLFSISFFASPLIVVPSALLRINFSFKKILIITVSEQLSRFSFTMLFIYLKCSYFSLAYGYLIGLFVNVIVCRFLSPKETPWQPLFNNFKRIISFGIYLSITNFLNRVTLISSDFIIGKLGTTTETAIYSRGVGFIDFLKNSITMSISPVTLPYLSKIKQINKNQSLNQSYIHISNLFGSVCWPILAVASIVSEPIIHLFFGNQWSESAQLVPGIAFWILFKNLHPFAIHLFTVNNLVKIACIKEFIIFTLTILTIYFGYQFSLSTISLLMIPIGIFDFLLTSYLLFKYANLNFNKYLKSLTKNILLISSCCISVSIIDKAIKFNNLTSALFFTVMAIATPIIWVFFIKIIKLDIYDEIKSLWRDIFHQLNRSKL